jgi:hypothetical protein
MQVLTIVAYRQAVSQAGIESVRGTSSDSAIGTLLQRQLIAFDDHRLFTTTPAFLNYLGLRDLADCLRSRSWKARDCDSTCVDADNEPMSVSRDAAAHIVGVLWPTSCSRGRLAAAGRAWQKCAADRVAPGPSRVAAHRW